MSRATLPADSNPPNPPFGLAELAFQPGRAGRWACNKCRMITALGASPYRHGARRSSASLIQVCCLYCSCAYEKLQTGHAIDEPRCPSCGYVGWMPLPLFEWSPAGSGLKRSAA
jgi:hypothetical protein